MSEQGGMGQWGNVTKGEASNSRRLKIFAVQWLEWEDEKHPIRCDFSVSCGPTDGCDLIESKERQLQATGEDDEQLEEFFWLLVTQLPRLQLA